MIFPAIIIYDYTIDKGTGTEIQNVKKTLGDSQLVTENFQPYLP